MTTEQFNEMTSHLQKLERDTFNKKVKEYMSGDDRLSNFKQHGYLMRQKPEKSAMQLLLKNFLSLNDAVVEGRDMTKEFIEEKLGDTRCYLTLIYGCWLDGTLEASDFKLDKTKTKNNGE